MHAYYVMAGMPYDNIVIHWSYNNIIIMLMQCSDDIKTIVSEHNTHNNIMFIIPLQ